MDGDDAIIDLAGRPAVWPLDSGRLTPLLRTSGLVEDADDSGATMPRGDQSLEPIPHQEVVPLGQAQGRLQGLGSHAGGHCDGLGALPGQVRELSLDINAQVSPGVLTHEAIVEAWEECPDPRARGQDLVGCHVPLGSRQGTANASMATARNRVNTT